MRAAGRFPEGIIGGCMRRETIVWGNTNIVERFTMMSESNFVVTMASAPAGPILVTVFQTKVQFWEGNIYHEDLGRDLNVAVIIPQPCDARDAYDDEAWDRMWADPAWREEACLRSSEFLVGSGLHTFKNKVQVELW